MKHMGYDEKEVLVIVLVARVDESRAMVNESLVPQVSFEVMVETFSWVQPSSLALEGAVAESLLLW